MDNTTSHEVTLQSSETELLDQNEAMNLGLIGIGHYILRIVLSDQELSWLQQWNND